MKRLRRERDIAPGQTLPAAISGISDSAVSWPSLSTIACLKFGCSGDSTLARKRVPSSTPSAPSAIAAASPRPSATPPAVSTGIGADRIDHHRREHHARHPADMAAAFGALRDDDVGAGLGRLHRLRHAVRHERDLAAGVVRAVDIGLQVLVRPRPGELHHLRPQRERRGEAVLDACRTAGSSARTACWFARAAPRCRSRICSGVQIVAAHGAEPAGIRHRGDRSGE